jgi:2,4-dienoyl-CoA reductase-like NADH-dependent reductase (Old Yellow Enzyme family)
MKLLEKTKIRSIESRNRIIMSPMAMYSAKEGVANDFHLVHYGSRAFGGAGIIVTESTAVEPFGRITIGDLGIYNEKQVRALKRITEFIKNFGSVPAVQLAHAGRKAGTYIPWEGAGKLPLDKDGWKNVAPSGIPYVESWDPPEELSQERINGIIKKFGSAAERSLRAGFEVIEIHAAHGYLIHEFLSSISNKRKDRYGGSIENRSRLLIEIVQEVRSKIPEGIPLFVRVSGVDFHSDGLGIEDAVFIAKSLEKNGVDLIDCSSGGILPTIKPPMRKGYNVSISKRLKKEVNMLVSVVGLIFDEKLAEEILERGWADFVTVGKVFLRDPYWPNKIALNNGSKGYWPIQYERGYSLPRKFMNV